MRANSAYSLDSQITVNSASKLKANKHNTNAS